MNVQKVLNCLKEEDSITDVNENYSQSENKSYLPIMSYNVSNKPTYELPNVSTIPNNIIYTPNSTKFFCSYNI